MIIACPPCSLRSRVEFAFNVLLCVLREENPGKDLVEIVMRPPFDCLNTWSCSLVSTEKSERDDQIVPFSKGFHSEEAISLFDAFDLVFEDVFPEKKGISRKDASFFVQDLMRKVYTNACLGNRPDSAEDGRKLLQFSRKMVEVLRAKSKAQ